MHDGNGSTVGSYGLAVAALAAALLLRWVIDPIVGDTVPFISLFGAVAIAVWSGGPRPALLVVLVGYLACSYLFIEPRGSVGLSEARNLVGFIAYLLTCFVIIAFGEAMRSSQRRFEELVRQSERSAPPTPTAIEGIRQRYGPRDLTVLGFGLTLTVLLLGSAVGTRDMRRVAENEQRVSHTLEVIGKLEALLSSLKDAETGQRGYLLTEEDRYLDPYMAALRRLDEQITQLENLTSDNPEQEKRTAGLKVAVEAKVAELQQTIDLLKNGNRDGALAIVRGDAGRAMMDDLRDRLGAMRQEEDRLLRQRSAASEKSYRSAGVSLLLTAAIGILLVGAVFLLEQRNRRSQRRFSEAVATQRDLLRVTLASIGDAVITTDTQGRITYLNTVAEDLTAWRSEDAVGQRLDEVFHIVNEVSREPVASPAERALKEGVIVGLANHTVLVARDGSERAIDDSAAPIRNAAGEVAGCVLIFRDVSERRALEKENERHLADARFLASIVESSDDAIVSKTTDGIIQSWNAAAHRLFGYPAEQAVGKHISLIIPEDRLREEEMIIRRIRDGERIEHFETVRLRADASPVHVSVTVSPLRNDAGAVVGASKIVRDITDRRVAEERIYKLVAELEESDRRKDEFLAMLAHELRGPLAPLRNMLEVLRLGEDDVHASRLAVSTMNRQLNLLVRLVDDLLDVSRITRGKLELRKERMDLSSVIQQSLEMSRPLAERSKHRIDVSLPQSPIFLSADRVRLTQVFSNLLHNACKYTPAGGHISLAVEEHPREVVISIKDSGIGIAPDKLDAVFELFTQVERGMALSQGGLGIGLTLVKRLVAMHGGSVEARSDGPDKGSEFVVRLPVQDLAAGSTPAEAAVEHPTRSVRLLIVDDNEDSALSLSILLERNGNETRVVHDGLAAVEMAEQFRPDAILLDLGLPRLDGFEVCRRIREQSWGKSMLIVALTGWGQEEDRRKSSEAGFDHHMVKPLDLRALREVLAPLTA